MITVLTVFLSEIGKGVHIDRGHQNPECTCAKALHRMGLVSEN